MAGTMTDQEKLLQDAVQNRALAAAQNTVKPTYAGTFEGQLNDIFDKIQNREPFNYNVNEDPLYQSYKDQYIQGGKLAMKDTMGQAAALTGGYGNTYGQQVGQQAYNAYLQNLSAVIPELYDRAYGKYQDEGDDLKDQFALAGQLRDTEYGRYRDDMGDWEYDQKVAAEREQEDYNRRTAEEQRAWQQQQQNYSNLVALIKASGAMPTDEQLAAAGMNRADADALRDEFNRQVAAEQAAAALAERELQAKIDYQNAQLAAQREAAAASAARSSGGGGGGSRSSGGGGGGSSSTAAIQRQLNAMGANLDVDGIWGPQTQAAYDRYMGGGGSSGSGGSYKYGTYNADYAATAAASALKNGASYTKYLNEKTSSGSITPAQASAIRKDLKRLAP